MMPSEDMISALHDDILLEILTLVPIKDAVKTMVLSKRWRFVWTLMPKLDYTESDREGKSVWDFLDKSLQLHRATLLESLCIKLRRRCPVDADLGKWVSDAVDRYVRELKVGLFSLSDPTSLPKRLYTCKTLVKLTLFGKILVDVPSLPCLPSLESLALVCVVYKDQDSHAKLLSSCPVLRDLFVVRNESDNVTRFNVKVPSLQKLTYVCFPLPDNDEGRPLVIDSPGLHYINIADDLGDYCSIQNMPRLEAALVSLYGSHPKEKLLTSFSSVKILHLFSFKVACCSAINFLRLIDLKLYPSSSEHCWMESLMLLLHNAPKLKALRINSAFIRYPGDVPLSWNQPSSVPGCMFSRLENLEWKEYRGRREEKQFVAYILANSKCLKTVGISPRSSYDDEEKQKIREELETMYRLAASSQLLFFV